MIYIIKANGKKQAFSPEKVKRSCLRAGASEALANEITKKISWRVRNGMSTREIWKLIFRYLSKETPMIASRFSLKEALFRLGPEGFHFEKLVARIFAQEGYQVEEDKNFSGACVEHEIDVIAKKENELLMIECKFHNQIGIYIGVKDTLYVWARWLDLRDGAKEKKCPEFTQPFLVSNTKFSEDAQKYAACKNLSLIGWAYPAEKNLQYFIEKYKLYPITVLRRLEKYYEEKLLRHKIITCQDLIKIDPKKLQRETGLDPRKIILLKNEAKQLITNN